MTLSKTIFLFISILVFNYSYSQIDSKLDSLLVSIGQTENSKTIIKTPDSEVIRNYGDSTLFKLAVLFSDTATTKVFSECQNRILTKGEIAIILADHIEQMPYFQLTGIQNDILQFCEKNPNLIEFYLDFIKDNGVNGFQEKYFNWLISNDRTNWKPFYDSKPKKDKKKQTKKKKGSR